MTGIVRGMTHSDPSKAIRLTLAGIFAVFTFCYIYILQPDMLAYMQHVMSRGTTTYNPAIGTFVILVLVFVIHAVVVAIARIGGNWYAFSYMPSALFLAVLTDLVPAYSVGKLCAYSVVTVLIVLCLCCIKMYGNRHNTCREESGAENFISNTLIIAVIMVCVGLRGNSNDVLHYELKMQRLLNEQNYDAAAAVGKKSLVSSHRMTCLRAFALARKGLLGETMFEYPVTSVREALFLHRRDSVDMIFNPNKIFEFLGVYPEATSTPYRFLHRISTRSDLMETHPQVRDYLLATLLLRKNLDLFAAEVKRLYDFTDTTMVLPKHYREALILYMRSRTKPVVVFKDNITETNYKEFNEYGRKYVNPTERANAVRRNYGDTYWWFYFYCPIAQ